MRDGGSCIHNSSMPSPGVTLTIWSLFSLFIALLYHPDCVYGLELTSKPAEITPPVATGSHNHQLANWKRRTTSYCTHLEGTAQLQYFKITLLVSLICTVISRRARVSGIIETPSMCLSCCPPVLETSLAQSDSCVRLLSQ